MSMRLFHLALLVAAAGLLPLQAAPPSPICNRVVLEPVVGKENDMSGGLIQGSNVSRTEGFVTLAEVKDISASGQKAEITLENKKLYRWLRYAAPEGFHGKIGKAEFYCQDKLLGGASYASFPSTDPHAVQFAALDLLNTGHPERPNFKPVYAGPDGPLDVTLQASEGVKIRYTLDGTWPTLTNGEVYSKPVHLDKTSTMEAVSFLEGEAPSLPNVAIYVLNKSGQPGFRTAHIGNSLTGTTGGFARFLQTAGIDHKWAAFLRGGALTSELWALASGDFAKNEMAARKEKTARERNSLPWDDFWRKIDKVDHLTLQPRDFDLDREVASEINFIKLFREKAPDLQPWLYCEWVEMARQRPSDKGEVPSSQMKKTYPALTWEESMSAMLLYVEELQKMLNERYHEGKRPRIIPAALAMGWIRNMIDHGKLPGVAPGSFYPLLFGDQVHPKVSANQGGGNGAFLVDMTWYSAFYREPSEGKILPVETSFTPDQAHLVQGLAWDVIKNYPDCGLYEEGKEPCGKPEFATESVQGDVTRINLHSSTPGAWFRYTLDGTPPTRTNGYVYCGVISFRPGMTLKAIAYKSGMADSQVSEAGTMSGK